MSDVQLTVNRNRKDPQMEKVAHCCPKPSTSVTWRCPLSSQWKLCWCCWLAICPATWTARNIVVVCVAPTCSAGCHRSVSMPASRCFSTSVQWWLRMSTRWRHASSTSSPSIHMAFCLSITLWPSVLTTRISKPSRLSHADLRWARGVLFKIPFYREILLWKGCADAWRQSADWCLKNGRSISVVPGGEREQMLAQRGSVEEIVLKERLGFVRLALRHGVPLLPCYCFGEAQLYHQSRFLSEVGGWRETSAHHTQSLSIDGWSAAELCVTCGTLTEVSVSLVQFVWCLLSFFFCQQFEDSTYTALGNMVLRMSTWAWWYACDRGISELCSTLVGSRLGLRV